MVAALPEGRIACAARTSVRSAYEMATEHLTLRCPVLCPPPEKAQPRPTRRKTFDAPVSSVFPKAETL